MADPQRVQRAAVVATCVALGLQAGAIDLLPGDLVLTRQGDGLLHLDTTTDTLTPIAVEGYAAQAGLVLAPDGGVVFPAIATDPDAPAVVVARFEPVTGTVTVLSSGGLLDVMAYDIAIASDGQLYVALGDVGVVAIEPSTGQQSLLAAPPAIPAALAIATDETDRLWVAAFAPEPAGLQLAELDRATGQVLAGFSVPECPAPRNGRLLAARAGELFVNCSGTATLPAAPLEARVLHVNGSSGSATVLATGELLEDPYGLALEDDGDLLVVGSGRLVRVDGGTGVQTLLRDVGRSSLRASGTTSRPMSVTTPSTGPEPLRSLLDIASRLSGLIANRGFVLPSHLLLLPKRVRDSGRDDLEPAEVAAVAPRIARQQGQAFDGRAHPCRSREAAIDERLGAAGSARSTSRRGRPLPRARGVDGNPSPGANPRGPRSDRTGSRPRRR